MLCRAYRGPDGKSNKKEDFEPSYGVMIEYEVENLIKRHFQYTGDQAIILL